MNMFSRRSVLASMLGTCALAFTVGLTGCSKKPEAAPAQPQQPTAKVARKDFKVAVSIYAGWMPWYFANEEGILKRWADKYNLNIKVEYMSYPASLEAFVAGRVQACVMTNMEALDMPAAAGIDTTVVITGDFSNGNDAILTRKGLKLSDLKGQTVTMCEKTVSQYMFCRALEIEKTGLAEKDVTILNISDEDIANTFLSNASQNAVVTWNPMVMEVEKSAGVTKIFDSSKIPGEIQDLMVVNTAALNENEDFARALTGAWYEVLNTMSQRGPTTEAALTKMAELSKCSLTEFKAQLRTTNMFYTPQAAIDFTKSAEIKAKNDLVRNFCYSHNLLGEGAPSVDVVGIQYPDGFVQGDKANVKLRYTTKFMEEARDGKLAK